MRKLICVALLFHKKLAIPSLAVTLGLTFLIYLLSGSFSPVASALIYTFFSLLFQYFLYDVGSPGEYYFFHNLGLSRLALWISTAVTGLFITALSSFL